jgi:hypothetical protein
MWEKTYAELVMTQQTQFLDVYHSPDTSGNQFQHTNAHLPVVTGGIYVLCVLMYAVLGCIHVCIMF